MLIGCIGSNLGIMDKALATSGIRREVPSAGLLQTFNNGLQWMHKRYLYWDILDLALWRCSRQNLGLSRGVTSLGLRIGIISGKECWIWKCLNIHYFVKIGHAYSFSSSIVTDNQCQWAIEFDHSGIVGAKASDALYQHLVIANIVRSQAYLWIVITIWQSLYISECNNSLHLQTRRTHCLPCLLYTSRIVQGFNEKSAGRQGFT